MESPEINPTGYVILAPGTIASDYSLKSLNEALGKAQAEFVPATKSGENKYSNFDYTKFSDLVSATRPALTKNHLTVSQFAVTDLPTKTISIHSRLVHWDSGEWIQNQIELPAELALGKDGALKFNQNTIGGSQTYGQKYAYKAIVGIPDSEETVDSAEHQGNIQSSGKRTTPAEAAKTAPPVQEGPFNYNAEDGILICKILGTIEKQTKQAPNSSKPPSKYFALTFNGRIDGFNYGTCFDTALFDALKNAEGKETTLKLKYAQGDKFINITDVLSINKVLYEKGKPSVDTTSGEMFEDTQSDTKGASA